MQAAKKLITEQPVCEICGGPLRSSNSVGVCKRNPECKAEAQRRRYAASNERRRANARQWRREHREQHLANKARYRKNNPESVKESARKIREKNGVTPKGKTRDPCTPTWIYALCNDRDQVLYIGQTVQELSLRLWHHRQEEDAWRAEIAYIRPIDRVPFKDADRVEQAMIRVFRDRGCELHNKYLIRLDRTANPGVRRRPLCPLCCEGFLFAFKGARCACRLSPRARRACGLSGPTRRASSTRSRYVDDAPHSRRVGRSTSHLNIYSEQETMALIGADASRVARHEKSVGRPTACQ
jgi:hypothetical protein